MVAGDSIEVVVLPGAGARLHRLKAYGHDLLHTPTDPREHLREPFFWGAYNMAPWCNRIDAGPTRVGRRTVDLASNFADGSAIHGQAYARPWRQFGDGQWRFQGGDEGWPWRYEASVRVTVADGLVVVEQGLLNLDDEPMPAGIGLHPWFRPAAKVTIRAEKVYPKNHDSPALPSPVSGSFDLRRATSMSAGLDATWVDLADPAVELWWPELDLRGTIRSSAPTLHVTAANPPEIDAVAIEPQTHAPQGLRRLIRAEPGALTWLKPGATLGQRIEFSFELGAAAGHDGG